jgi:hypothetical protein
LAGEKEGRNGRGKVLRGWKHNSPEGRAASFVWLPLVVTMSLVWPPECVKPTE